MDNRLMQPEPYVIWINTNSPVSRKLNGSRGTSNSANFHSSVFTTWTFWSAAGESTESSNTNYTCVVHAATCLSAYIPRISQVPPSLLHMLQSCKVSLMLAWSSLFFASLHSSSHILYPSKSECNLNSFIFFLLPRRTSS